MAALSRLPIALALLAALTLALPAAAQVYKWVDKDGKVHYSDKPPRDPKATGVKDMNIESKPTDPDAVAREQAELAARSQPTAEAQQAQALEQQKAEKARAADQAKAQRCEQAKARLAALESARRMVTKDKDGKEVYSNIGETNAEREKTRAQVAENCG